MEPIEITWSNWEYIDTPTKFNKSAIYRIRMVENRNPVHISRFLGIDKRGILSIGKTSYMENRRKQFVRALTGVFGHSEGNLLEILERVSPLKSLYPDRRLEYSFAIVSITEKDKLEELHIKSYVKQYGEVPPLNSAIPKRYDDW